MKLAKGSLAVQEETGKNFSSSLTSWGWTIDKYNKASLSPASFNLFKPQHAELGSFPLCTWEQGNKGTGANAGYTWGGIDKLPWKTGNLEKINHNNTNEQRKKSKNVLVMF